MRSTKRSETNTKASGVRRCATGIATGMMCLLGTVSASLLLAQSPARSPMPEPPNARWPASGLYVAVGYGGRRMSSRDGQTWENDTEWAADGDDENCLFSVVFAKNKFVAVGGGASVGHIVVTRDGKTWTEVYKGHTRIVPILFGNGRFVVGSGRDFLYSEDGENRTKGGSLTYPRGLYYRRGAFGNGVFVFCGDVDIADNTPRGG